MQEETTQKTIALAIKTSKLTASVLQKAMKMYLEHQKHKEPSYGKIPVKKLVGQGEGAKSIEVTDSNIKSFERVARKYNVDFAVKKDKTTEPPRYLVFFKGKDADVIAQAFKEFVKVNEKKQQRPSLRQKLKGLQKMIAQNKNRERSCNLLEYLTQRDIQTKNSGVNVRYRGKHRFFKGFNEFIKEKTRRCDNDFEKIERHVFF